MTLPIENYLAFFPATITVGMGWLRRPVRLGPLTIGRAVLLDALGVDPQRTIAEKDAALVAYVLSGEVQRFGKFGRFGASLFGMFQTSQTSQTFQTSQTSFNRFSRRVKRRLKPLTEAVNKICTDAFTTYVKPPRRENKVVSNTKTGAGWTLDFAEALCADYGWSWETAMNMPLATVFALSAAALDRYGLRPNGFDYEQRKAAKERKRHG